MEDVFKTLKFPDNNGNFRGFTKTLLFFIQKILRFNIQYSPGFFFHQPAYPRGEGPTIKRISPPRNPPAEGNYGVSAVGFTGNNRPSELTCIYFSWSPPRVRGGIRKVGGAYELGIFHLHVHVPV